MQFRITPAPAGSTRGASLLIIDDLRITPRACGEHHFSPPNSVVGTGSPPRLRGAPFPLVLGLLPVGITPAPAGSTNAHYMKYVNGKDHPRACGEHPLLVAPLFYGPGSPPRLRGAHNGLHGLDVRCGITPAPAGSTRTCPRHPRIKQDHPRACGEHMMADTKGDETEGSPPRLRGAPRGL